MSIKTHITDSGNNLSAHVRTLDTNENGLITITHPLREYQFAQRFFLNPYYGVDMNQNGTGFQDITELIYDENTGPPAEWTWSAIVGLWDFASTTQHYNGSYSIDGTQTGNGSISQGANGALFDLSDYDYLIGHIYITAWSALGTKQILIRGYNTGTGTIVGNNVDIGNYVNKTILNTWQRFIIPLVDMNLQTQTIDAIRIQTVSTGGGVAPNYYLDVIEFGGSVGTDTTGVLEYSVEPGREEHLHICGINLTLVDDYDSTLANATMSKLPYNSLLGIPELENGILFRVKSNGRILFTSIFKTFFDFITLTPARADCHGSDGATTWLKLCIEFVQPIILKAEEEDKLSFFIQDDLSSLLRMRASVCAKLEI